MADETRNPDALDGVEACIEHFHDHLLTSLPARVESYDNVKQCVNAQPYTWKSWLDGGDRELKGERMPVVMGAPVLFPGSGKTRDTWPIEKGSTVILLFASASTDLFLLIGREVDPKDPRRHSTKDAFAIPAGHSYNGPAKPGTTAPMDARVVHVGPGLLLKLVSAAASNFVAINADLAALTTKYNDLVAKFNAHGHLYVSPAGTAPSAGPAALPTATVPSVASSAAAPVGSPRVKVP